MMMLDAVCLCDCSEEECDTPFENRLVHVKDECIHLDGVHHAIHQKKIRFGSLLQSTD